MKKDKLDLLKRTIEMYGADLQIEMLIEESAELIHACQKYKRTRLGLPNSDVSVEDLISEAVDVALVIDQLKLIFPDKDLWQSLEEVKLIRLKERLDLTIVPAEEVID